MNAGWKNHMMHTLKLFPTNKLKWKYHLLIDWSWYSGKILTESQAAISSVSSVSCYYNLCTSEVLYYDKSFANYAIELVYRWAHHSKSTPSNTVSIEMTITNPPAWFQYNRQIEWSLFFLLKKKTRIYSASKQYLNKIWMAIDNKSFSARNNFQNK